MRGEATGERLSESRFHVIILALDEERGIGLETFLKLKEAAGEAEVIVLAGIRDEPGALQAVSRGGRDYLGKHDVTGDLLARIFDPYFTTKEKGSGLGLATCYSIVRKHDGHVTVESTPGEGTVFRVFLPTRLDPSILLAADGTEGGAAED